MNSNKITDLVPDIRQLRTLEVLDVSSNQFQTLAKNLDYLYTLRRLNVANNQYLFRLFIYLLIYLTKSEKKECTRILRILYTD